MVKMLLRLACNLRMWLSAGCLFGYLFVVLGGEFAFATCWLLYYCGCMVIWLLSVLIVLVYAVIFGVKCLILLCS